ncbi:hypothetical protein Tco_0676787 [Tanacetum coccineum]
MSHFKGMSYDDIRPIFERLWDQNQSFVPMDSEKEKGSKKKGSRKKSLARKSATEKQSEESTKRKKIEDDIEKEELKDSLDLVPREEFSMEIESLATKADGGSKNYKIFSEMLDDFDRQDVMDLHRLVEERNQAIIQGDRVNIQSRNSGNAGRNNRRAYVQEEIVEGSTAPNEIGNDEAGVILTDEQNDFLFADASRMEEIEELSANICLMTKIKPADNTSDAEPSYDSAFISEVQSSSNTENEEQMYPTHTKIINSTIGDDQIDSDIIFDSPNGNVNSGSIEKDAHVPDLCALEQLAKNAYQEAKKQLIFAQKSSKTKHDFD